MGVSGSGYLLDANVFGYFWSAGHRRALEDAAAQIGLVTVAEVRRELGRSRGDGAGRLAWLDRTKIDVRAIELGAPSATTLAELTVTRELANRGKGERECIALAAHDHSLCFVANDQNAMWLALRELHAPGERLIGVPVFLRRLADVGVLRRATVEDVFVAWRGRSGVAPTWWSGWVKNVPR